MSLKTKSATHCLTEFFPIYQNEHWTIRWRGDCSGDPPSHRITYIEDIPQLNLYFSKKNCLSFPKVVAAPSNNDNRN